VGGARDGGAEGTLGVAERSVQLVPFGDPAHEALEDLLAGAQAGDPLAAVTVVVPTVYAALSLRRRLATRLHDGRGFANVRFELMARVAGLLGAPRLEVAGRRPLTAATAAEIVRRILQEVPGPLSDLRDHPSTVRGLERTLADLRHAGAPTLHRLRARGARAEHVVRCLEAYRKRTRDFYDADDLTAAAAGAMRDDPSVGRELGFLVVHLPDALGPCEQELVAAFAATTGAAAVLGLTGEPDTDAATVALAERLATVLGEPVTRAATADDEARPDVLVLDAPDPDDEVRAALREVVGRAQDGASPVRLSRVALLHRVAEPYARIAFEQLAAAGIPANGPTTRRLHDSGAGRVLGGALELATTDFRRDALAAWLATAPLRDPGDEHGIDAHRWDVVSRLAGVVAGVEQWTTRLDHHAARLERRAAELREDPEATEARREAVDLGVAETRRLRAFVARLAEDLTPPEPTTWQTLSDWAIDVLDRYTGGPGARTRWPEVEQHAAREIVARVRSLGALDDIGADADLGAFRLAVARELDTPLGREGTFGHGVFVGPLRAAVGTDFDVVVVLGMSEGSFPPGVPDDPLLPSDERAGTDDVHARATRQDERRRYLAALACSPARVLTWSRADVRAQRASSPARWLLDEVSRLAGRVVGAPDLAAIDAPWYRSVGSFESGLVHESTEPVSLGDLELRELRCRQLAGRRVDDHPFVRRDPSLVRGLEAVRMRTRRALGRFDGYVGDLADAAAGLDRLQSATSLQRYATCPRQYFLSEVLGLREVERPEATEVINGLDRGTLVHEILEAFVRGARPRTSPDEPWSPEERARLLEIAREQFAEATARGITGRPLLWEVEQRRITRVLADALDADEAMRARLRVVPDPQLLELSFGEEQAEGAAAPVEIDLGDGGRIAFRGRIDRVDRSPDGTELVVLDYKTGRDDGYKGFDKDPVDAGTRLQLPIYALAAQRVDERVRRVFSYYFFLEPSTRDHLRGYEVTAERLDRLRDVLRVLAGGVRGGLFPANPGSDDRESWENCRYCAFDRICARDRGAAWQRVRADERLRPYVELAERTGT
jgi:RecB family exonuclease